MTTVRTVRTKTEDPLGYPETDVIERLRHMALDELGGVNADAVAEEEAVLRARLMAADEADERLRP